MTNATDVASDKMNNDREKALDAPPSAPPAFPRVPSAPSPVAGSRQNPCAAAPAKTRVGREADQQALVAAAIRHPVRESGPAALTARAVAVRAGTAIGSVYTAFPSLEALRLGVNAATMGLLRDALGRGAGAVQGGRPLEERLLGLADAYMGFAETDPGLWAALFEPRTLPAPPAMAERTADLFALLEDVLREAGCTTPDVPALGRALWAAVHGTVFLTGHGSLGPVRPEDVAPLVHTLVTTIASGIARQPSTRSRTVT